MQRTLLGLTQAGLAAQSRVNRRRLGLIERGLARPTSEEAEGLIAVLSRCPRTAYSTPIASPITSSGVLATAKEAWPSGLAPQQPRTSVAAEVAS